ncbi:MAG: cyclic nucleotide-binding domain-containing protein [Candidatus Dormibacteria bacterium]
MPGLATAKLFAGLPERELQQIAAKFDEIHHPAGWELIAGGEAGAGFMVVAEGQLDVALPGGRTRELGPGDAFGEMALLDKERRSATVRARTDVTIYWLPAWGFKSLLVAHPEVGYRLLEQLSRRVRLGEGAG